MDVIVVFNGLGNQMSQYAFYLAKKERNKKCHLIFDPKSANRHNGSELDKLFGVRYSHTLKFKIILLLYTLFTSSRIGKYLSPFLGIRFYYEPRNYDYSEQFLMPGKGLLNFYIGGWHSEKYFRNIRSTILNPAFCSLSTIALKAIWETWNLGSTIRINPSFFKTDLNDSNNAF